MGECLVMSDSDGKIKAMVYPDMESAKKNGLGADAIKEQMDANLRQLNSSIPAYSRVDRIELRDTEFEKTPKRSIKRYLYTQ